MIRLVSIGSLLHLSAVFAGAQGGTPGPHIAFVDAGIRVMNADGTGVKTVAAAKGTDWFRFPAWSPDGNQIAFFGVVQNAWGIWAVNVNGSGRRLVCPTTANVPLFPIPDWSRAPAPDGQFKIVFTEQPAPGNPADITIANADGTGRRNLSNSPSTWETYVCWSRNGSRLYAASDWGLVALDLGLVGGEVAIIGQTLLGGATEFTSLRSAYTFDGVTHTSTTAGKSRVYITDLSGPAPVQRLLTPSSDRDERWPSFSPDDTRLVFNRHGTGTLGGLFTINADGTGQQRIASKGQDPMWRPASP